MASLIIEIKGCNNSSRAVNLIMYTYSKNFLNNISDLFKVILCYCILQGCLGRTDQLDQLEHFNYSTEEKKFGRPKPNKTNMVESAIL